MPELPDIVVLMERLNLLLDGARCDGLRLASPFVLRSVEPPPDSLVGARVRSVERLGKRVVIGFDNDVYAVFHLMISGRFQWRAARAPVPGRIGLLALDFEHGTLTMTEASPKKRASLHLVVGRDGVADHDPGGVDVFAIDDDAFMKALRRERHTLKRTLTDPRTFSGIGNAYSDEILHDARLSPVRMSDALDDDEARTLLASTRVVLERFTGILRNEKQTPLGPDKMTAFRPEMAVHGKAGQPCPRCGDPVQRIATADTETNYCATCQTGGRLLKDRALSRLMKDDFPKTLDDLELMKRHHRDAASVDAARPKS
jgi:formamidopyrimidine-DNA glycosylase